MSSNWLVWSSKQERVSSRNESHDESDGVRVRFRARFQAVKVPIFGGFPVENPTKKANRLKALLRVMSLSEYGLEGFRVRLRWSSEYGSVAYLVERPTRETWAEQYLDTVLIKCLKSRHWSPFESLPSLSTFKETFLWLPKPCKSLFKNLANNILNHFKELRSEPSKKHSVADCHLFQNDY